MYMFCAYLMDPRPTVSYQRHDTKLFPREPLRLAPERRRELLIAIPQARKFARRHCLLLGVGAPAFDEARP